MRFDTAFLIDYGYEVVEHVCSVKLTGIRRNETKRNKYCNSVHDLILEMKICNLWNEPLAD